MTEAEQRRLVDAGFTRLELEAVISAVQFGMVLAEAGEVTEKGVPVGGVDLSAAKVSVLLGIFRDMKAGDE